MKKSLLIIGLFSLMMVLTSFTAPNETGGKESDRGTVGTGSYDTGGKESDRGTVGTGSYDTGGKESDRGTVGTGS